MKKKIAQKWVKALRSGKYKQEKGALSKNGGYCCLGVLCELAMEEKICSKLFRGEKVAVMYDGYDSYLPKEVIAWAGMKNSEGNIEGETYTLAGLNDRGEHFLDIADIIEDNYKDL